MAGLQSQWRNLGFQRTLPVLHLLEMPTRTEERGRYKTKCSNTMLLKAMNCIVSNYKEADFSWKPTLYRNLRKHPAVGCSPLMLPEWSVPCLPEKLHKYIQQSYHCGKPQLKDTNSDWTFPVLVNFSILVFFFLNISFNSYSNSSDNSLFFQAKNWHESFG